MISRQATSAAEILNDERRLSWNVFIVNSRYAWFSFQWFYSTTLSDFAHLKSSIEHSDLVLYAVIP
jgi:hypothetical protein